MTELVRPALLVLASTYPRWPGDHEPGFVHELCKRLTGRFDVTVVTSRSPGAAKRESMDGVDIVRYAYATRALETLVYGGGIAAHVKRSPWKLGLVPTFVLAQYITARRIMRQRRISVIHAHWLIPQGAIARRLARRNRVPFVVTSHGGDLYGLRGSWMTALKRVVARASAAMTVVSSTMRDEARRLGVVPPRLEVLPMGADMYGRFTPAAQPQPSSDELLFVGRLVAKKGLPHLLDAMPVVLKARPSTRLTIVGFGPEENALKAQADRLGIADRVRFAGAIAQEQLPELYRRSSLLVTPFVRDATGDQEGLPVVLMEAIACGCPVLAGRVAGVADLLGDRVDELSIDPTDTQAFAAAILAILNNPNPARERARALRSSVAERFDWSVIASAYGDLLEQCAASGENARASGAASTRA